MPKMRNFDGRSTRMLDSPLSYNTPKLRGRRKTKVKDDNLPRLYGTFGPLLPYGADKSGYWERLSAFNTLRGGDHDER